MVDRASCHVSAQVQVVGHGAEYFLPIASPGDIKIDESADSTHAVVNSLVLPLRLVAGAVRAC